MANFKFIQNNIDVYLEKCKPERLADVFDVKSMRKLKEKFNSEKDTSISKDEPWKYLGFRAVEGGHEQAHQK